MSSSEHFGFIIQGNIQKIDRYIPIIWEFEEKIDRRLAELEVYSREVITEVSLARSLDAGDDNVINNALPALPRPHPLVICVYNFLSQIHNIFHTFKDTPFILGNKLTCN